MCRVGTAETPPAQFLRLQVYDRLRDLAERDQRGEMTRPLVVFPEGTTTNGRFLLHFRIGAFRAGLPVQPVLLSYTPGAIPLLCPLLSGAAPPHCSLAPPPQPQSIQPSPLSPVLSLLSQFLSPALSQSRQAYPGTR